MTYRIKQCLATAVAGVLVLSGHATANDATPLAPARFWELSATAMHGEVHRMADFRGAATVIVAAPRTCGRDGDLFYRYLEDIRGLHPHTLEILAFPFTNNDADTTACYRKIRNREAQGSDRIRLMEHAEINGPDTHPVFQHLKRLFNIEEMGEERPTYFLVDPHGVPLEVHHGADYETLENFANKYAGATRSRLSSSALPL